MQNLSIIIPLYNEENTIIKLLNVLLKTKFETPYEILIIDDGSTDNSYKLVNSYLKLSNLKNVCLYKKNNEGKGSAINFALNRMRGDVVAIQDADIEYNPKDLSKIVSLLLKCGHNTVIYGSRFLYKTNKRWVLPIHYFGNILLSLITSILYGVKVTDMETCYKVFYKSALKGIKIKSKRFGIESELTVKFIKNNLIIKEVPVSYLPRNYKQGKKIKLIDGIEALFILFKYRFKNDKIN